jgi:hypothetical protein
MDRFGAMAARCSGPGFEILWISRSRVIPTRYLGGFRAYGRGSVNNAGELLDSLIRGVASRRE